MQIATILLNIGGDAGNQVQKYNVTPAEAHVLQVLHGNDAVNEIEITGDVKRSSKQERERLVELYSNPQPDGGRRSPAVDMLFPGVAARLYETFDEMDLEDHFFKGGNGPVDAAEADAPAPAKKTAKKTTKKAAAAEPTPADEADEDDGIEDMPDADKNLFE